VDISVCFCHFTQPSSGIKKEKSFGGAKRLSEAAFFMSSTGFSAEGGTSGRLPFLLVRFLWASKENERAKV
jgi:hypothetical protein